MAFTMTDTSTPYGDPGDVYWDDPDDGDGGWYEYGRRSRMLRRERSERAE